MCQFILNLLNPADHLLLNLDEDLGITSLTSTFPNKLLVSQDELHSAVSVLINFCLPAAT